MESKDYLEEKESKVIPLSEAARDYIREEHGGVVMQVNKNSVLFCNEKGVQAIFMEDLITDMNKKKGEYDLETKETKLYPMCVLCKKECENEFGNNPHPLRDEGKCCFVCNKNRVIPSRLIIIEIKNIMEKVKKREREMHSKSLDEQKKILAQNSIQVQEEVLPLFKKLKAYQ